MFENITKQSKITIVLTILLLGYIGYSAYKYKLSLDAQHQTEIDNQTRKFEALTLTLTQALNTAIKDQKELTVGLSKDYQDKLAEQKQQILARIDGTISTHVNPIEERLWELKPGVYSFPKEGASDPIIDKLIVDTFKKPESFKITFKPQDIKFNATLNFSKKDETMSFWVEPQTKNIGGMEVKVSKLELQPSDELNGFITELRGSKIYLPVMPKYTINFLGGVGSSITGTTTKNPYIGGQFIYNTTSGIGIGAMGISNGQQVIILGSAGYSFKKRK